MEIFLSRNGQQFGPYTLEWVESFLADGTVSPADLAWTPGREAWVPVSVLLAELRPQSESAPESEAALQPELALQPGLAPQTAPEPVPGAAPAMQEPVQLGIHPDVADSVDARPGLQSRISLRGVAAVAAGIVLILGLTLLGNVPKHASISPNGDHVLLPDDGYTFLDAKDPFNWQVRWTPGLPSRMKASMLAGAEPGSWQLAPGYELPVSGTNLDPVWAPGKRERAWPHVRAGESPGTWIADPGYVVSGTAIAPAAQWIEGVSLPHMTSADREGWWNIDDGYSIKGDSTAPVAVWTPGKPHSENAHIYAARDEGRWLIDSGYERVSSNAGDWRTYSPARTAEVLRHAASIDAVTVGINCESASAILTAFDTASSRYGNLDLDDVHPNAVTHLTSVRDNYSRGATIARTCFFVENAGTGATVGAALACVFANDWGKCMDEAQQYIDVAEAAEKLGGMGCDAAWDGFLERRNEVRSNRYQWLVHLHGAAAMPEMVTCR